jgi:alginate O-acetyltransferase complex protein AlgI
MLFNSFEFLLFFPIVAVVVYTIRHPAFRLLFLLAASYFFYMWWRPAYILLLLASTGVDYFAGLLIPQMETPAQKRLLLLTSIITNLGLLGVFKYFNFGVASINGILGLAGSTPLSLQADWVLPVGISFYTFQSMSYTIDVYRRRLEPERNPLRFGLYVAFFPQLVAGPIERGARLLPQLTNLKSLTADRLQEGVILIVWGLYKKMVIADGLARFVDPVFSRPEAHAGFAYLIAIYAFSLQIFADFSGYTDIARGAGKILGVDLMENFRKPYFAYSIQDFWRRWHISLSTWLRDYLYVPLGGNRRGVINTYRNLLLTMALGGLWHGASWTFVIWGIYHGVLLAIGKVIQTWLSTDDSEPSGLRRVIAQLVTFHLVCVGWVFFRSPDLQTGLVILRGSVWWTHSTMPALNYAQVLIIFSTGIMLLAEAISGRQPTVDWILRTRSRTVLIPLMVWALIAIALFSAGAGHQFIYFQF